LVFLHNDKSVIVNGMYLSLTSILKLVDTVLPDGSLISKVLTVIPTGKVDPGGNPATCVTVTLQSPC